MDSTVLLICASIVTFSLPAIETFKRVSVTRPIYLLIKPGVLLFPFIRALRPEFPCPVGILTFAVDSSQVDSCGHVPDAVTEATTLMMCEVLGVELVNLY